MATLLTTCSRLPVRRLSAVPPQLQHCTRLKSLDLPFNQPLRLVDVADGRNDAKLFSSGHCIRELGLRRVEADPWPNADAESMVAIAISFTPAPKVVCCEYASAHLLDIDTQHLATWIN